MKKCPLNGVISDLKYPANNKRSKEYADDMLLLQRNSLTSKSPSKVESLSAAETSLDSTFCTNSDLNWTEMER